MSARFNYCLKIVLQHEGGKSNHKADRGGKTCCGITQAVYDDFCKASGRARKDVYDIAQEEVEAIYMGYWKSCKADILPEPLDLLVFDYAVNSGPKRAIRYLQIALGVDADGLWGPQTQQALREEVITGSLDMLCRGYLELRRGFLDEIVEKDPGQSVFLKGWLARVDHLEELAT